MRTSIPLIAAACFVGAAFAVDPPKAPQPGPELKAYDVWVGDWQYEGETMASPLGPAGKFAGKQTARWILNGFFLEFRWEEKGPLGDIGAVELDWYDAATKTYPFQGFQNNGDMYSAAGTVNGNVWKNSGTITHLGTKYLSRGVITFAADGMSITWENEVSVDGKAWQIMAKGKAMKVTPAASAAAVEQELIKLEQDWAKAYVARDLKMLDRVEADDYIFTDPEGVAWTKAEDIGSVKSGEFVAASFVSDDIKVRLYGDSAVVSGRNTMQAQYKGKDASGQSRWTDTWIKRNGVWQCVATHSSKIPAPTADTASVQQELIKLERAWADASAKADIPALEKLLADELTFGTFDGQLQTKVEFLDDYRSRRFVSTSELQDGVKARVFGDVAVVTGRTTMQAKYQGADASGQYLWTDTWVKRDGRWLCVASHGSKVAQK